MAGRLGITVRMPASARPSPKGGERPRSGRNLAARHDGASTSPRRLDRGDVDFLHGHHGIKRALCFVAAGRQGVGQYARSDLPGNPPLVLAPAARALLAAVADDGIPIAVGLLLIVGGDLEREGFVMLERGTPVEAETRNARNGEFDRQHVALFARSEEHTSELQSLMRISYAVF